MAYQILLHCINAAPLTSSSMENALDLVNLCGKPDLALHLECDDTILMERIMARGAEAANKEGGRADDNFQTALKRL